VRSILVFLTCAALFAQTKSGLQTAPVYGYKVVKSYPHDHAAFTQGLQYLDGKFFEGTGLNGRSSIRRVDVATGHVEQKQGVSRDFFGEGITVFGNQLFELTWQSNIAFVYDKATFKQIKTYPYKGEGWGLTTDGKRLIFSDGSHYLRFIDPATFQETGRIAVTDAGKPIDNLNELEYIKGEVWANVWQTNRIARIDPKTGYVNSWIDMTGVLSAADSADVDVLNGIAYDEKGDRIFITGKLWPRIFEIKVGAKK
jgi:glutaminyl-peptide cyclotransferase